MEDIANVIRKNSNLEQLNLANGKLGSCSAIILQALTKNTTLKSLNLANSMSE